MCEVTCPRCQVLAEPSWHVLGAWTLVLGPSRLSLLLLYMCVPSYLTVRKQEIIKVTEQLIEAISNGDFESYT